MTKNIPSIDISIVIPVYCNQDSLEPLFDLIKNNVIAHFPNRTFEVIFIDDGSKDASLNKLFQIKSKNTDKVKIIKFTRNFGQNAATIAGIKHSVGQFIVMIDADLQDPPELMVDMINYFFKDNDEIIICTRAKRKESLYRRGISALWYGFIQRLTFPEFPKKGFNYFGISNRVKQVLLESSSNANPLTNILVVWTGFPIKYIPYTREKRTFGKSEFTFYKKIRVAFDSLVSFSFFPIRFMTVTGFIVALLGFVYAAMLFISYFAGGEYPFKGWTPIMILILILSGLQMLMLGVLGEYLWRTLDGVRNRALYIIEKTYDQAE